MTVGIGELKAKLSSYVGRVRSGERVIVTDHGEEVAVLVPISKERRVIKSLIEAGLAQWSGGKPKGFTNISIKGESLSETIMDKRK